MIAHWSVTREMALLFYFMILQTLGSASTWVIGSYVLPRSLDNSFVLLIKFNRPVIWSLAMNLAKFLKRVYVA